MHKHKQRIHLANQGVFVDGIHMIEQVKRFEKNLLYHKLQEHQGDVKSLAKDLKIQLRVAYIKLNGYNLDFRKFRKKKTGKGKLEQFLDDCESEGLKVEELGDDILIDDRWLLIGKYLGDTLNPDASAIRSTQKMRQAVGLKGDPNEI